MSRAFIVKGSEQKEVDLVYAALVKVERSNTIIFIWLFDACSATTPKNEPCSENNRKNIA